MHSDRPSQFTVYSKSILPFDLNVTNLLVNDMQSAVPQTHYRPSFYPPPLPGSRGFHPGSFPPCHGQLPGTQEHVNAAIGYYPVPSVVTPQPPSRVYHPSLPNSACIERNSPNARDSTLRHGVRQRTAHACEKCRERKTKCSGDRPICQRCTARGLVCTYSDREVRGRGPLKTRLRGAVSSTELRPVSGDSLANSPTKSRKHKAMAPSKLASPLSSPIRSSFPLPSRSPLAVPGAHGKGAIPITRDPRRVQSYSTLGMTGAETRLPYTVAEMTSHELTPRPGDEGRSFEEMLSYNPHPNRRFDLRIDPAVDYLSDNSAGSDPHSATDSQFSFSSASESGSGRDSRCSSTLGMEDLFYDIRRTSTPVHLDSYASSPASMSSPSSAAWNADLEPKKQGEVEQFYAPSVFLFGDRLAEPLHDSSFTYPENYQQRYMLNVADGAGFAMGDHKIDQNQPHSISQSNSDLMSQFPIPDDHIDRGSWETFSRY